LNLRNKKKLLPLVDSLKSAYKECTYSHGQHTSRVETCYSQQSRGMYDHIIFTPSQMKVLSLLEIPEERFLAPSRVMNREDTDGSINMVTTLPNSVFPSDHLRLEVEFELLPRTPN